MDGLLDPVAPKGNRIGRKGFVLWCARRDSNPRPTGSKFQGRLSIAFRELVPRPLDQIR